MSQAPPTGHPYDLPHRIGRYQTRAVLGVGGFAVVVRAYDEGLDTDVAIKVLSHEHSRDADIRARFTREAQLLRRVRSAHVVAVHDLGELADGRPYLVMEFASGGVLADRMPDRAGVVDPDGLIAVITALAAGLGALHDARVVHRDVKPANLLVVATGPGDRSDRPVTATRRSLVDEDERLVLGDLGLAKDQGRTTVSPTILGGTPYFRAPEQTRYGAEVTAATDVYAATGVLWSLLTAQLPPTPDDLGPRLEGIPPAWRELFERGLAADPDLRIPTMSEWAATAMAAIGAAVVPATGLGFRSAAPGTTCPYKGLAAFQPEDASLFYGREAFVDELVSRLRAARKLVIGGPSGSGKSSLLRAGLIPAVESGALPGSQNWPVLLFTPGSDALGELHHQLSSLALGSGVPSAAELRNDPRSVRPIVMGEAGILLAIDQFEELFTLNPPGDAECLLAVLAELVDPARSQVRVALSLRADFYGEAALHPWLARCISDNQVLVGPMQRAELRRAIEGPAHRVGLRLEEGLADAILDEEGAEPGSLPLVAHALMETWLRRRGSLLTLEGFRGAGGVAGAIAQRADELYEMKLDESERVAARRLLLRLVNAGDGVPDTRRRVEWAELGTDDATRRVVDTLADARLLIVDHQTVEIAHEAIIQRWPRLGRWIDETRDELRTRQRIDSAAAEWDGQERNPALLYRGTPLDAALEWAASHSDELTPLERDFLETSEGVRRDERDVADAVARRRQRARWAAIGALGSLATAAVIASVFALVALQQSRADERHARDASTLANERFARALATQSISAAPDDPLLGIALGAESLARSAPPLAEARGALVGARVARAETQGPVPFGAPLPVGDALTVTMTPDGETLITGGRDGNVTAWNLDSGTARRRFKGHTGGVQEAAVDPTGDRVATAGADGTVWVWDLTGRNDQPTEPIVDLDTIVWSVAFSPDGSTLATASEDATVRLFDTETGDQLGAPVGSRPGADFITVAFSPRGDRLVAGTGSGEVFSWALPSRAPQPPFQAHTSDVWELVFDPAGEKLLTGSSDGTARVWSVADWSLVGEPFRGRDRVPDVGAVSGIVVSPDGTQLLVGGDDGAVWSSDLMTTRTIGATATRHLAPIIDAERSGDGTRLATLGNDQTVRLWDLSPAPPADSRLGDLGAPAFSIAADRRARRLAVGDGDGSVHLLDAATGRIQGVLGGHSGQVFGVAYVPSGATVVTGDEAGALRSWDRTTRRVRRERRAAHSGPITSLAVNADGLLIASSSDDGTVKIWNTDDLTPRTDALGPHVGGAKKVVFTPDGEEVLAATGDGKVRIWQVDGREGDTIAASSDALWGIAVSRDGSLVATAGADGVVALWDRANPSSPLHELTPHPGGATDVAFADDGETLVTTSRDGSIRFWDRRTGQLLGRPFTSHSDTVWRVAVGHDHPIVWTAGVDGEVRAIDVLDVDRACELAAASFDSRQRDRFVGGERLRACER